jgi:putative ABC transport system ATP-binding protein
VKVIRLQQLIPHPIKDEIAPANTVWGKDILLEAGRYYLVSAPSGTGKTTFLSCIYGTRNDYAGSIFFDQKNIGSCSLQDWSELRQHTLSMVFQDMRLFPQLTALENIQIKNALRHTYTETQIRSMADQLGVAEHLHKKCGILSLGQQQRIAIIRALCQPFRFLLLDEPFSHIDAENIRKASALIMDSCTKNEAALLVTSLGMNSYFSYHTHLNIG